MSLSSDLRSTMDHEYLKLHGDVVVGSYSADGVKLTESVVQFSPQELARRQNMYNTNAAMNPNASIIPTAIKETKKAGKKGKAKKIEDTPIAFVQPIIEPIVTSGYSQVVAPKKKFIYLHNKLGKIKMSVESVLSCEMAFALVFANEDDMIFVPNPAETLNFVDTNGDTHTVYFSDTIFDWIDGDKKVMILFKTND
jgi:hypothetical protein